MPNLKAAPPSSWCRPGTSDITELLDVLAALQCAQRELLRLRSRGA